MPHAALIAPPRVTRGEIAPKSLASMDVDELQEEYKTKLNVTQVRGPKARDHRWLIDKINGGLTVRAKRAQDKQGGGGKRARAQIE